METLLRIIQLDKNYRYDIAGRSMRTILSKIAQDFLDRMASTANALDLNQHMTLISRHVGVFGMPGFDVIDYDGYCNQYRYEFENRLLKQVGYKGLNVLAETPDRIMFISFETVVGDDSSISTSGIEFIISKEVDGQWRVTQERVLPDDELENDIRRSALQAIRRADMLL